jgi:hypothetical protein
MSQVTRHASHITRHTSNITRHTSHITHHTSHITHHTSHITHHTSHVTRHTSPDNTEEEPRATCAQQAERVEALLQKSDQLQCHPLRHSMRHCIHSLGCRHQANRLRPQRSKLCQCHCATFSVTCEQNGRNQPRSPSTDDIRGHEQRQPTSPCE